MLPFAGLTGTASQRPTAYPTGQRGQSRALLDDQRARMKRKGRPSASATTWCAIRWILPA